MGDLFQGELFSQEDLHREPEGEAKAQVRTVFLDWDEPLLDRAVACLAGDWSGGVLDLGNLLVLVPTKHAGRRLREALAVYTGRKEGAVIPPIVVTPDFLVSPARLPGVEDGVAGGAETLFAWIETLRSVDLARCRNVFPVDPVERSFSWALQTASHLIDLRKLLGESGLTIGGAATRLAKESIEPQRWRELARLERSAVERLAASGLFDPQEIRSRAADEGSLPAEVTRVVMLAVPDPLPLAIRALERLARSIEIEVVVYAPESLRDSFDAWGRPRREPWNRRRIDLPVAEDSSGNPVPLVHQVPAPPDQAKKILEILAPYADAVPPHDTAVCVPDPDIVAPLRKALEGRNLGAFEPNGRPLFTHEVYYLLETAARLVAGRSAAAFHELIRCPEFARALEQSFADDQRTFDHCALLAFFDEFTAEHLPDTIDDIAAFFGRFRTGEKNPAAQRVLDTVLDWLKRLASESFGDVVTEFLGFAYSQHSFDAGNTADAAFGAFASTLNGYLDEMDRPLFQVASASMKNADRFELLLHLLKPERFYLERESTDVDLQGWLEIFWEDAPHVILSGFNDGRVPETRVGDPFLPNSALIALALRDNDYRLARDAYYFTAILEPRRVAGRRTDVVLGHVAADGSPLRPSRLLFRCADDELPRRALDLFGGRGHAKDASGGDAAAESGATSAWTRTWTLKPPPLPEDSNFGASLSVTSFRSYLSCPFRFYLSKGLGMREQEIGKLEMDRMEFGNLCHHALRRFGENESIRESADPAEIRKFLEGEAESRVNSLYGDTLPVPVLIQLDSVWQRLAAAAGVQAALRAEGWKIEAAEWKFHEPHPWILGGMPVHGVIDRIDRHEESGKLRVIDYKTTGKPRHPEEAHLPAVKRTESPDSFPGWALFTDAGGKLRHWTDLQLPLYVLLARERFPGHEVEAAYFNLPRAAGLTALTPWEALDEGMLAAAKACAEGVIEAVRARRFWPPADSVRYDDFESVIFGTAAESFDGAHFEELLGKMKLSTSPETLSSSAS